MDDSAIRAAEGKAQRFQEELARRVGRFEPLSFAFALATQMDRVFHDPRLQSRYPPHLLLHAMAANCAYHRPPYSPRVLELTVSDLMRFYSSYYDPMSEYLLEHKRSPHLWLAYRDC